MEVELKRFAHQWYWMHSVIVSRQLFNEEAAAAAASTAKSTATTTAAAGAQEPGEMND